VLDQILAAPTRWTQDNWLDRPYEPEQQAPTNTVDNCETTGCFAGWTVVLAGYKTDEGDSSVVYDIPRRVRDAWEVGWERGSARAMFPVGVAIRDVAAVELGLTGDQASELFGANNTLRDLYGWLSDYTDGEIEVPDELPVWADYGSLNLAHYFDQLRLDAEDVRDGA
jgi:hypothetical protein